MFQKIMDHEMAVTCTSDAPSATASPPAVTSDLSRGDDREALLQTEPWIGSRWMTGRVPASDDEEEESFNLLPGMELIGGICSANGTTTETTATQTDIGDATEESTCEDEDFYYDTTGKFKILKLQTSEVNKSGKEKKDNRIRNSVHECTYCQGRFTNIAKHLQTHREEREIMEIQKMKDDGKKTDAEEKSNLLRNVNLRLTLLRQQGDHKHNIRAQESGHGELYVGRRNNSMAGFVVDSFKYCKDCLLWLHTSSNMSMHSSHCIAREKSTGRGGSREKNRVAVTSSSTMSTFTTNHDTTEFERTLRKDEVGLAILGDELLLELGMYRAGSNSGNETGKIKYARDRMRRMARLLLEMQQRLGTSAGLKEVLVPINFEQLCQIACKEGNLESDDINATTPHAARRIKEDLIKCLELKESLSNPGSQGEKDARKLIQVGIL